MSKDLALQQTEWDTHENKDFVPLEFTEETKPDLFGLEVTEATKMISGLSTTLSEREVLKDAYIDVITLEITTENLPMFKELRLKIRDNRTKGIQKWKEREKAFYLAGGNFIQAIYNREILVNEEMESKLMEAEKFFENQEKERLNTLNLARIERLKPYIEDTTGLTFHEFDDESFDDYVLGKKTRFENDAKEKAEAEAKAENERLAEIERQKAIEVENAKLKAEAELKAKALEKERAEAREKQDAIELKAKQEREKAEEERKIEANRQASLQAQKDLQIRQEREAKEKLEAEIKAKADAEEKAKLEAKKEADKLAKAPIKKQLSVWVNSFDLPTTEVDNETTKEIKEKFESFKKWAQTQINNL